MNVYHYDENGIYTHTTDARQSPLEPGVFLVPANATTIHPPSLPPSTVAVFNGVSWEQVVDNRGRYYNQDRAEVWINSVGETIPEGCTVEPRELTAAEVLRQKIKQAADTVESLIQARVDAYNEAHGLAFSDVHNCESYSRVQTYSHRQFCEDVWLWSVDMWETARSIQAEVIAGQRTMPTAEEFIAMLPEYDGVE